VYDAATYNGKVLGNGVSDIQLATAIGLHVEVAMLPRANLKKTGAQQLEQMYSSLLDANITVKSVWVKVTPYWGSQDWSSSYSSNVQFLNSLLQRALQRANTSYGLAGDTYGGHRTTEAKRNTSDVE
ncbi:hypothetical protein OSTOST_22634, partial [Ostertagia ostertagi]